MKWSELLPSDLLICGSEFILIVNVIPRVHIPYIKITACDNFGICKFSFDKEAIVSAKYLLIRVDQENDQCTIA